MKIDNPLQMNDWETKKLLKVVLAVQVVMWIVIGLGASGIKVPVVRELFGFVYLTFIPGILILRILRLHKLGSVKTLLYSVGISVALVMFGGLLVNAVGPAVGVSGPLSILPLTVAFSVFILGLCALSYIRDKDFSEPGYLEVREILSPPVLSLFLLPLLSVLGALVVKYYQDNRLLLCLMALIAVVVVLAVFNRFIGKKFYPLAIAMIAIALITHFQMSFFYLAGTDIQGEYYVFRLAEINSHWAASPILTTYNTMLSITIMPVAYSVLLGMDGIGIFKLIYPLLFCLVPLGLYEVYQRQTDEKTAFLSAFFFMSFGAFISTLSMLVKMQVAGLFLMLLIMLLLSREMDLTKRVVLFIIFAFSLVVSHYGVAYYFIFYILIAWLFTIVMTRVKKEDSNGQMLTVTLITMCLVFTLTWYLYISNSAALRGAVIIGNYFITHLSDIFVMATRDPQLLRGLGLLPVGMVEHTILREVAGWLHRVTYVMIVVGIIRLVMKHREMRFAPEYLGMALAGLVTIAACVVIPYFSTAAMETNRILHLALFFLAPFCILGGETIFNGIKRLFRRGKEGIRASFQNSAYIQIAVLIILIPYFLFNIGFIFEVAGDPPSSLPLGQERLRTSTNEVAKASFYGVTWRQEEVLAIEWLSKHRGDTAKVYCDVRGFEYLARTYGMIEEESIAVLIPGQGINEEAYIYLRYLNITEHILALRRPRYIPGAGSWMVIRNIDSISSLLENNSRIYANAGSEAYYVPYEPPIR